jgi:hypothetical protein
MLISKSNALAMGRVMKIDEQHRDVAYRNERGDERVGAAYISTFRVYLGTRACVLGDSFASSALVEQP